MKIGMDIDTEAKDSPMPKALQMVGEKVVGLSFTEPEHADIVITDYPHKCLQYLKDGKYVMQFVYWHHIQRAEGLETAPIYKDRFKVFKLFKDEQYGDFMEMFAYIAAIIKKEKV